MSKYIAYQVTEDHNIIVVDERQFTIGINIPNYLVDLYLPILGYDGIGVITVLYRFIDKQQRGTKKYKPRFNIKQYATAGRVGDRTLNTILDKLVRCKIIRVRKPEGIARRWHHHTEIILLDPPREVPEEFRAEVIMRSPAQWLFTQESSDNTSSETLDSDEHEASDSASIKASSNASIKASDSASMKASGNASIKASDSTSMLDVPTWDVITEDAAAAAVAPVVEFLSDQGVITAQEFAHLDLTAVKARVAKIQRNPEWRPSDIVTSLRNNPPPPAPAIAPQRAPLTSSADAERRARVIAPDATKDEIALLTVELEEGASDDQALDWLANHRVFQARWAASEVQT